MNSLSDETLMERIQNGHLEASGLLYQRYKKVLFAYFFNCTRQKEGSEDLVQITFEKMLKYARNYKGQGTVKSWLFSIARNAMKDQWRKQEKHQSKSIDQKAYALADLSTSGEEQLILSDREALLHQAMQKLAPDKRELLALVKLKEKKYKEVAAIYQLTEANVKVKTFRIMKELRDYMESIQASEHY